MDLIFYFSSYLESTVILSKIILYFVEFFQFFHLIIAYLVFCLFVVQIKPKFLLDFDNLVNRQNEVSKFFLLNPSSNMSLNFCHSTFFAFISIKSDSF